MERSYSVGNDATITKVRKVIQLLMAQIKHLCPACGTCMHIIDKGEGLSYLTGWLHMCVIWGNSDNLPLIKDEICK
jgi:hypothetical protein